MRITFEKEEIQLIGQLVIEIVNGQYNPALLISAILIYEFKVENASVFERPEQIKRKLKLSTIVAFRTYLQLQNKRGDIWWDLTLGGLLDKFERIGQAPPNPGSKQLMLQ